MNWGRLITAMVTPFDSELNVDYNQAVKLAEKLVIERSSALLLNGTTGESPTLTSDEVYKLISEIKKNVNIPVIAGVGTNNTKKTIENIKNIEDLNVDGLLVITPYYNKPNQESLYEHFKTVAQNTDLPIIIYNVPGRTGVNISVKTLSKLAEIKNIVAIKEASGDMAQFIRMVNETPGDFLVYSGEDILTLPSLAVGGYGIISVASNVSGKIMGEMIDAFENKDMEKAAQINLKLTNLFDALFVTTNPIPVKYALNSMGFNVGGYRLPLTEPTSEVKRIVNESLTVLQ
ncbi:4-hydroxy-tetrahydrodipicolinate synthase [Sedimentibacter sp.]|uniref:4-hydroxy-tetrahydrodipicolinate synthase n=1 Tax=Sedimentibacter sp. TaxID=1960295 RepID=UPI0028A9D16A|nr:4-hydroxy-tetrahydrodipicolinate synthase [Sedimentibacter sp.]